MKAELLAGELVVLMDCSVSKMAVNLADEKGNDWGESKDEQWAENLAGLSVCVRAAWKDEIKVGEMVAWLVETKGVWMAGEMAAESVVRKADQKVEKTAAKRVEKRVSQRGALMAELTVDNLEDSMVGLVGTTVARWVAMTARRWR